MTTGVAADTEPIVNLGASLREARREAGLSLREVARQLGVSPSFVSKIENGRSLPSVATLYSLSQLLGVSMNKLFQVEGGVPSAALHTDPAPMGGASEQKSDERTQHADRRSEPGDVRPASPRQQEARGGLDLQPVRHDSHASHSWNQSEIRSRLSVTHPGSRARLVMNCGVIWEQLARNTGPNLDFIEMIYPPGSNSTSDDRMTRHEGYEYGYLIAGELEVTVGFDTFTLRAGDALGFDSTIPHRYSNMATVTARGIWFVQHRHE